MVPPVKYLIGWAVDYLNGRCDHNQTTMRILIVYTCPKMWAQSDCGQDLNKGRMLAPGIKRAPDSPSDRVLVAVLM